MILSALLLSSFLLIPMFLGFTLAIILWENRIRIHDNKAIILMTGILIGVSIYSLTYCIELFLTDSSWFIILVFFRYLGIFIFLILMISLIFRYIGYQTGQSKLIQVLISLPGFFFLFIVATNEYHQKFYPEIIHITEGIPHFTHTNGIFYLPVQAYGYALLILIIFLLFIWMISSPRSYGPAIWILLAGSLLPLVCLSLYHLGIRPFGYFNLTPYSLIITAVTFFIALVQHHLYVLKPIAYRKVINAMPVGILFLDENRRIIEINEAALTMLHLPAGTVLDKNLDSLLDPGHPVLYLLGSAENNIGELKSGERSIYLTKKIQTWENGEVIGTLILLTDITRQKEDEKQIQENELLLHSIFASTNDGILIIGLNHQVLAINDRFWEIWNIPSQKRSIDYEPELMRIIGEQTDDPAAFCRLVETINACKAVCSDFISLRDGKVLERYSAPLTVSGKPAGRIWIFHDITDLKETERLLIASEARYRLLLDNAPDLIWQLNEEGQFTYISPSLSRILGYAAEQVLGMNFLDLVHPDDVHLCEECLMRSIQNQEKRPGIEYRVKHADGSWHWHQGSLIIVSDENEAELSVIGTSRDINDIKIAEVSLKNANRQLNLLTSITRHDILNIVNAMNAYLEVGTNFQKPEEIGRVFSALESLVSAIRSEIEYTKVFEILGSHDPIWHNIKVIFDSKRINLPVTLAVVSCDYEILADPMFERVFDNLLDNSVRHGSHVSEISLSCQEDGDKLHILYSDNGIGVPETEKCMIFSRGYGENTGMGLFLVREILHLTGISIAEIGQYGSGARFEMIVPADSFRRLNRYMKNDLIIFD